MIYWAAFVEQQRGKVPIRRVIASPLTACIHGKAFCQRLRGKKKGRKNKQHFQQNTSPTRGSSNREPLASHKDLSVHIFRCTKTPSFPTRHQSITTIEQTAAISTGRETLPLASTELKRLERAHAERGKRGATEAYTPKTNSEVFAALIATLSTRIGFDGFFTCLSQR